MDNNKTIFLKDPKGELVEYSLEPVIPVVMESTAIPELRVALVVGHYEVAGGKHSKAFGLNENELFSQFIAVCDEYEWLNFTWKPFYHINSGSYTRRQQAMATETENYDLVLELHFNAFNGKAEGAEALFNDMNKTTQLLAKRFIKLMNTKMGIKKRYAKPVRFNDDKIENGEGFLRETKHDALVLEPFFGDNLKDCNKYNHEAYAHVLNDLVAYYREIKK